MIVDIKLPAEVITVFNIIRSQGCYHHSIYKRPKCAKGFLISEAFNWIKLDYATGGARMYYILTEEGQKIYNKLFPVNELSLGELQKLATFSQSSTKYTWDKIETTELV